MRKKPVKKKEKIAVLKEENFVQQLSSKKNSLSPKKSIKKYVLISLVLIIAVFLLYYFKGLFITAVVNGEPISRIALIQELEKQYGKQTLSSLVTKTLILQEAKKQNVSVSNQDIDSEIKKIEDNLSKQGQTLDQALLFQGMTKENLIDQIKTQKLIEKMLGKDIKISNKEIDDYIEQNKENLPADKSGEEMKTLAKQQLTQKKLVEKYQSWIGNLQKNAKISYF